MDSRVFAVVITYQSEDDCAALLAELARQCAGVIVVGVLVGGRTLERTGPDLLQRIKAFPTT